MLCGFGRQNMYIDVDKTYAIVSGLNITKNMSISIDKTDATISVLYIMKKHIFYIKQNPKMNDI